MCADVRALVTAGALMPFDLSNFRTARIFWVVKMRNGQEVPGRIVMVGDGPYADIRVENDGAQPVAIANGDILSITGGRVVRLAGWFCYFGHTSGDTEVDVWCTRGGTTQHLIYRKGTGFGAAKQAAMSDEEFQAIQGRIRMVVETNEDDDE